MPVYRLGERIPRLEKDVWIAPSATVVGAVELGDEVNVWFGAVIRADNEKIRIGRQSNVQESAVLHVDPGFPLVIGERVTVGHQAMLHGCTIGEESLVGIQAVILNGATIGRHCLIGAGALVTEGKSFPDGSLIIGAPAKVARPLTAAEIESLQRSAATYVERARLYRKDLEPAG
jgi:carbonic anhydrase/acetyltransferase-like protein (isoleucine patch superfamily)